MALCRSLLFGIFLFGNCDPVWSDSLKELKKEATASTLASRDNPLPESALFRLGTLRFRMGTFHSSRDYVSASAMSSDGKWLALANSRGMVSLLSPETGKVERIIPAPELCKGLAFTPDGKNLVSNGEKAIFAWDAASGRLMRRLPFQSKDGWANLVFSADGKTMLIQHYSDDGDVPTCTVHACELATGKQASKIKLLHNFEVHQAISGNGKVLATWGRVESSLNDRQINQTVQVWDLVRGKELCRINVAEFASAAALSPDGRTLATVRGTASFSLWDTKTGREVHRWAGLGCQQPFMTFSPDSTKLMAVAWDGTLQVWDTRNHVRLGLFHGRECRFSSLAFVGSKIRLLAFDVNGVALWEVPGDRLLTPAKGHRDRLLSLAFTSSGKELVSASQEGRICFWDPNTGKHLREARVGGENNFRYAVHGYNLLISPDGKYLLERDSSFRPNKLALWELNSGKVVSHFEEIPEVLGMTFSPDARFLAAAGRDREGMVLAWNIATGQEVFRLKRKFAYDEGYRLALSPGATLLAGMGMDSEGESLEFFQCDLPSGKEICAVPEERSSSLAISWDGKYLAKGGTDITLLRMGRAKEVRKMSSRGAVSTLAFSHDCRLLATVEEEDPEPSVAVWELASGQERSRFRGHHGDVSCLAFSPDGKRLASGSMDSTILLWNLRAGSSAPVSQESWPEIESSAAWSDLASSDAKKAHQAMVKLRNSPAQAVSLFKKHLATPRPMKIDTQLLRQWIEDLGNQSFRVRDRASLKLEQTGRAALAALKEARKTGLSLELGRRIDLLLEKLDSEILSLEQIRQLRALEVLEHLAIPEARQILSQQAAGPDWDPVTLDASAALKRLRE